MKRLVLAALITMVCLWWVAPALGQVDPPGRDAVEIQADYFSADRQTGQYLARGNVRIRRGEMTLLADEVQWHPLKNEAKAPGAVSLIDAEGTLRGEDLTINMLTGEGRLARGSFFLAERNLYASGEQIERLSSQRYRLGRGTFTTCEGECPDWSFQAQDLEVTLGGFARGRHAKFYVGRVPVFYSPFFFYPAKTDRESGFLMPRYGYSDRRGWEVGLAYYQVIALNQDATVHLDYLTELGFGKGLEYRYIFSDHEGEAKLYHVTGIGELGDEFAFEWRNDGWLPADVRFGADVQYVSDRDYFINFGESAGEYNRDLVESKVFVARHWGKSNLGAQLKYLKNLDQPTDTTLQRLPEARFAMMPQRIGDSPFFAALDSRYDHFWRREGDRVQRLSLRPALSVPFDLFDFLEVDPQLAYRHRFYQGAGAQDDFEQQGQVELSTRVSSSFARVYSPKGRSVRRIQHVVSPDVHHEYVPRASQQTLPQFDLDDRYGPLHRLSYGLTNRLTVRIEPGEGLPYYHEVLYLRLSQSYDMWESAPDPLNPRDNLRPFSDLRAEMKLRPTRWGYFEFDGRYDFQRTEDKKSGFAILTADAGMEDTRGNGAAAGYRYIRDELEYFEGRLQTSLLKPVYAGVLYRYDLLSERTLETVFDLEYRSQCWSLFLTLSDRPDETRYMLSFALTEVGRVGKFGGSLGRAE
jgi:LPS-assembly protein